MKHLSDNSGDRPNDPRPLPNQHRPRPSRPAHRPSDDALHEQAETRALEATELVSWLQSRVWAHRQRLAELKRHQRRLTRQIEREVAGTRAAGQADRDRRLASRLRRLENELHSLTDQWTITQAELETKLSQAQTALEFCHEILNRR